jgi:cell division initiation protein
MGIIPIEISSREFKKKFRGYDPDEVRDFLENVSREMGELMSAKALVERELDSAKDSLAKYHELEDSIKETLLLAQRTKDDLMETAKKKSELIIEEAHHKSNKIAERFAQTRAVKKQFQIEFETLLESFRHRLSELREPEESSAKDFQDA